MRGVRIRKYCREYTMFERVRYEVFEKRAEKREDSRGKGESSSGKWWCRNDT